MAIAAISMSVSTTSKIASHRRVRLGERPGPPLPPPGPPVPPPVGGVPPPLAVRTADAPAAAPPAATAFPRRVGEAAAGICGCAGATGATIGTGAGSEGVTANLAVVLGRRGADGGKRIMPGSSGRSASLGSAGLDCTAELLALLAGVLSYIGDLASLFSSVELAPCSSSKAPEPKPAAAPAMPATAASGPAGTVVISSSSPGPGTGRLTGRGEAGFCSIRPFAVEDVVLASAGFGLRLNKKPLFLPASLAAASILSDCTKFSGEE